MIKDILGMRQDYEHIVNLRFMITWWIHLGCLLKWFFLISGFERISLGYQI